MVRLCELRDKEVINVCDGERLGNVCDIDFDEKTGQICTLIIPYQCVCRIGSDVVLVQVDTEKCLKKCKWD